MSKAFGAERLSAEATMVEKVLELRKAGKGGGEAAILAGFTDYAGYQRALGRYRQNHPDTEPETLPQPKPDPLAGYRLLHCTGQSAMPAKYRLTMTLTSLFLSSAMKETVGDCVQVLYSQADGKIAIVPCGETDDGALHVSRRNNGNCRVNNLSCIAMLCELAGRPLPENGEHIQLKGQKPDEADMFFFPWGAAR